MRALSTKVLLFFIATMGLATARAEAPSPPVAFLAAKSPKLAGAVDLSWQAVKGVSEYAISASRETQDNWHDLDTTKATEYQVNELPEGTKYYFRIASKTRTGQGAWSSPVMQYSSATKELSPALSR
jgi:hypothetical protein